MKMNANKRLQGTLHKVSGPLTRDVRSKNIMRTSPAILLGCAVLLLGCSNADNPNAIEIANYGVVGATFTPAALTAEQIAACQAIRTNRLAEGLNTASCVWKALNEKDPNRTKETWKIRGVYRPRFTMTSSDLTLLLGLPDGYETNELGHTELIYNFVDTRLSFVFNDVCLIGTGMITWD